MSEIFDQKRVQTFVKKASHGRNLGQNMLFDSSDPQQAEDMAIGLLTEYVVNGKKGELKKAEIAAGYLTRTIDDQVLSGMHNTLRYGEKVERIKSGVAALTYDIAGVAARSLRDQFASDTTEKSKPRERTFNGDFLNQSTGDVIRGLFEAGIISPGHAAAILVYFRLENPGRETDNYEQLMKQVQDDLATRIRTITHSYPALTQSQGVKIVEAYIHRRNSEAITLTLPDQENTLAVNDTLTQLYMIPNEELLPVIHPPRQHSKYENTVAPIDGFDD